MEQVCIIYRIILFEDIVVYILAIKVAIIEGVAELMVGLVQPTT